MACMFSSSPAIHVPSMGHVASFDIKSLYHCPENSMLDEDSLESVECVLTV